MTTDERDIASRAAIERLVNEFYDRVRADDILGPVFNDVDWAQHLPRMYDFWEAVLFGTPNFKGNPLAVHRELANHVPLGAQEFGQWLSLFYNSVDALFSGPRAEEAKARASRIAEVIQHHIRASGGSSLEIQALRRSD